MSKTKVSKVTVSLPKRLLDLTDRMAQERETTRSGLIASLIEKENEERVKVLMAQGYRDMSEENRRLADEAFPVACETMARYSEWDDDSGD